MKKLTLTLSLLNLFIGSTAYAADSDIIETVTKLGVPQEHIKINDTPIANVKNVVTPLGKLYITDDGKYLIQGAIYDIQGKQPENIEYSMNLKFISTIKQDAIVYKAENEKHIIYVFTDYTCGYCKKLHQEINDYLEQGISVHYFAFPRAGIDSDVGKTMQSVWSSKNRKQAFDDAYNGLKIEPTISTVSYVKEQYAVGNQLGLTGTPAIVFPNGQVHSGYIPANELIKILNGER